ncbi:DUF3558 family protein [Streptomyces sp. NPDC047072]|uniref:DUF3558 family protein n=1 Tax=Streptomyces sp. NPDC047072 TaxID=3154809 RepID=UPI0033FA836A
MALLTAAAILTGCGDRAKESSGGKNASDAPTSSLMNKKSIKDFDVQPLNLADVKPCKLLTTEQARTLGLYSDKSKMMGIPMQQTAANCYWTDSGGTVDVQIHEDTDGPETVAWLSLRQGGKPETIKGYPASALKISNTSCNVQVGVSDTYYLYLQVQSHKFPGGACALGRSTAEKILTNETSG